MVIAGTPETIPVYPQVIFTGNIRGLQPRINWIVFALRYVRGEKHSVRREQYPAFHAGYCSGRSGDIAKSMAFGTYHYR